MARNMKIELLTFSLYCISRKTVDTEYTYYSWCMTSTDILKWRKTNDYENFEKGMIYMKILKKVGSREKGEEEPKSMPHAPVIMMI
jgi:prenyltransferase beta subunit